MSAALEISREEADLLDAALMRDEFRWFVERAWPVLEPNRPFVPGPHVDALCAFAEAWARREFGDGVVNIPPRFMKSTIFSVLLPAWIWTWQPEAQFLGVSYKADLAKRDAMKTRRLIESPWYQRHFEVTLASDENRKDRFENTAGGLRLSSGVDGGVLGEGADYIVADDPNAREDAYSAAGRENVITLWDETISTRGNDPETVGRLVVQQRLHEKDLSGHVLTKGEEVEHLCLPMEFDPDRRCVTTIGVRDWRKKAGELLWPKRFGRQVVEKLKRALGSAAAGQLNQRPTPKGGGMIQTAWFEVVGAAPATAKRVRGWDQAGTEDPKKAGSRAKSRDPDFTAGARGSEADGVFYLEDMRRFRESPLGVEKKTRQTAELDGGGVEILLEQEPGSSGKATADNYLRRVLKGFTARAIRSTGSKIERAQPFIAAAEAGNVKLVRGPWIQDFLDECEVFPAGAHDDQIDATSLVFNRLMRGSFGVEDALAMMREAE